LTPIHLNLLLQPACHRWRPDEPPFLAKGTLAKRLKVDPSTIRRNVAEPEERGFLKRVKRSDGSQGQRANGYVPRPPGQKLYPPGVEEVKRKKLRAALKQARARA
jgi:DNA-binding MarR family transcriptional regulator